MASIAGSVAVCLADYGHFISIIAESASTSPGHTQLELSALQDELGRFKVWAGNIAAHKTGRSSLDFRLRDATPLRERIIELLSDMSGLLKEGSQIVAGDRVPLDETISDSDLSDDEGSVQSDRSKNATTELQQTFLDVVVCIDCLYKLSMTIRSGVSAHDRLVKAASIDTSFYETWDIQHVKNKFPATKETLATRLGKSISRRRQHLKYCEKHHRKLAQDLISPQRLPQALPALHLMVMPSGMPLHDPGADSTYTEGMADIPRIEMEPSITATTVLTQTTASEFVERTTDFEVESDGGQTSTSYGTTVSYGGKLSIPPFPRDSIYGKPFECPYWYTIVSIRNSHAWKKHIFRDLQPYVCTFENCVRAGKMFDSRREWFDHEIANHRKEWFCTADCRQSFKNQAEFEDHMRDAHQIFSQAQLNALADMCQRPVSEDAEEQCPLCMETSSSMKQLCRHLARHLEKLALFALFRSNDDERPEELDSDKPQVSDISQELSDSSVALSSTDNISEPLSDLDPIPDIDSGGEYDENDIEESDSALKLFRDANASETFKLPASFLALFNKRLQKILDGTDKSLEHQDIELIHLFTDLSRVLTEEHIQKILRSEAQANDLLLMVFIHARKCFQKRVSSDRIWDGLLDRVRTLFITIIIDTITESATQEEDISGLVNHLVALKTKLTARSQPTVGSGAKRENFDPLPDQDWGSYWSLTIRDVQAHSQTEVERQRAIHNFWLSEKLYVNNLAICLAACHEQLMHDPSVMQGNGLPFRFLEDGFAILGSIRDLHVRFLSTLKNRINTQGPWVREFSDIVRNWVTRAGIDYSHYAKTFPMILWLIQLEAAHNQQFKASFCSESAKLDWLGCFKSPSTRIQQYIPLLTDIRRKTTESTVEETRFEEVMDEVNTLVADFQRIEDYGRARVRLRQLSSALIFRQNLSITELRLLREDRHLLFEGEIERLRSAAVGFSTTNHAFLFDNYLVFTKQIGFGENERYEVLKPPIPIALLVLQDASDNSKVSPIFLVTESNKNNTLESQTHAEEALRPRFSPFIVKDLGSREAYTLLAKTEEERKEWCDNILRAKSLHATTLQEQQAEPFLLNALSNGYFQNASSLRLNKYSETQGSPLSQAIKEAESAPPYTAVRTEVNCGTAFSTKNTSRVVVIATKNAFFVSQRGESLSLHTSRFDLPEVKQLLAIEELDIFLVLASRSIYSYPIKALENVHSDQQSKQAKKLLDNVDFFRLGKRASVRSDAGNKILLFCATRQAIKTQIKVLELYASDTGPIERHTSILSAIIEEQSSLTPTPSVYKFKDYDEFYSQKRCNDIALLESSVAIMTDEGLEIVNQNLLSPDSPRSKSLPTYIKRPFVAGKRAPLGFFRAPEELFSEPQKAGYACAYDTFALCIDHNGETTAHLPIDYVGPAISAASDGNYLILFHDDFVEIRDMVSGELCQIITGQNVRYLEGDRDQGRNVMFVMAHPNLEGRELVLELVLNRNTRPRSQSRTLPPGSGSSSLQGSKTSDSMASVTWDSVRARTVKNDDEYEDENKAGKLPTKCTVS